MNKFLFLVAATFFSLHTKAVTDGKPTFTEWHDLQINSINRFPMHTDFFAYESLEKALAGDRTASANFLSLNGDWQFRWVANADERPTDFYTTTFDDSQWGKMPVPVYGNSTVSAILFTSMWVLRGADILKTIRRMYRSKIITWLLPPLGAVARNVERAPNHCAFRFSDIQYLSLG